MMMMLMMHLSVTWNCFFFTQSDIFDSGDDSNQVDAQLLQTASRVKDMGRLLMATEIRSAKVLLLAVDRRHVQYGQ